ncbi:MAG: SMI1/KNR4 family protein [Planctomycetota bacterium]
MPFPVDGRWIEATQRKLGVVFPASFAIAMSKANGGAVDSDIDTWELFPFYDQNDKKRIQRTCNSICRETKSAREGWYGFPETAVAIGKNGGGDLLVLLPEPTDSTALRHSVYWWDHETGETYKLADDFADLSKD